MKLTLNEKEAEFWKDAFIAALPSALEQPWERGGKPVTAADERCETAAEAADAAIVALASRMPPNARIGDAAIESVGFKDAPHGAKPNGEELEAIKNQLDSLTLSVMALQGEVTSLSAQLVSTTAVLSGRAVAQ